MRDPSRNPSEAQWADSPANSAVLDEAALIQAAKNGDLEAFNQLISAHQDFIYAQACRLLGDRELAVELIQKSIISAYQKLRAYRGDSFRNWLLGIVTNQCYRELRADKRSIKVLQPEQGRVGQAEYPKWVIDKDE